MVKKTYIEVEIDKLTNSIENVISGDTFDTEVIMLSKSEIKLLIKKDWLFDWQKENMQKDRLIYKLVIKENEKIIQGLISLSIKPGHIYLNLIESAKFNKGKSKIYAGVPGNLVAFACQFSVEQGFEGFVAFDAKTALIKHYIETLSAKHYKGSRMIIDNNAADKLIKQYFKKL